MKIAVMGYGTVGSGVVEVIESHQNTISKGTNGQTMEVAKILDLRDFPGDPHEALFTKDFNDILNDDEIKVVAETMGGVNPAFDFTMKLLKSGKSVVSSNKELVAQKGPELLRAAEESGANYLFEASVGGGIPIIRPMSQCLIANNIEGVAGILN
ncbi:MAG: homoserine dehydrogenase, partial [Eubacterium sp.]|nr:homoserine dehydrogenase [Eubacterium sp.]